CLADVGAALLRIVLRQGLVANLAARSRDLKHYLRALQDGELTGVADVGRFVLVGLRQRENSRDLIADIAEAAGLRTVAVNREVFARQRLPHEVRDDAAIVKLQPRTVGIEDADDSRIDVMIPAIR